MRVAMLYTQWDIYKSEIRAEVQAQRIVGVLMTF